mgnify:CR=1
MTLLPIGAFVLLNGLAIPLEGLVKCFFGKASFHEKGAPFLEKGRHLFFNSIKTALKQHLNSIKTVLKKAGKKS